MPKQKREQLKAEFKQALTEFVETFKGHISTSDNQWTVKGFIDVNSTGKCNSCVIEHFKRCFVT